MCDKNNDKKGTYKRYLFDGGDYPSTTKWRRQAPADAQTIDNQEVNSTLNDNLETGEINEEFQDDSQPNMNYFGMEEEGAHDLLEQDVDIDELDHIWEVAHIADHEDPLSEHDAEIPYPEPFNTSSREAEGDIQQQGLSNVESVVGPSAHLQKLSQGSPIDLWKALDRRILPDIKTTIAEAVLLLMNFVFLYNLPWVAMEDLFNTVNIILGGNILPSSKYLLGQLFGGMNAAINFHFYCPKCQKYLGKQVGQSSKRQQMTCSECQSEYLSNDLASDGSFFVTIPIKDQLDALLQDGSVQEGLAKTLDRIKCRRSDVDNVITDITDGHLYKKKRRELKCADDDLTITFNTDGSPTFKSAKTSIWPMQFVLNELPPKCRWENVIVCGLWFGTRHPNMQLFLDCFVEDMSSVACNAIKWTHNNQEHCSRVFSICACVDSPARAILQNTTQFNGYFGCSWCLHRGITLDGSSQVKYTVQSGKVKDRCEKTMLYDMKLALSQNCPINGVKGPSPLLNLPGFDIVWGFSPDYMHSILLGVVAQLTEIWLGHVDHASYIGSPSNIARIDHRLLAIKTPHVFTRNPRSVQSRKFWKASEWKHWLLHYSVPCLLGLLPEQYLRHWCLLVNATFLMLQDIITPATANSVDGILTEFVIRTEMLYGQKSMTSNVHQLTHHAKSLLLLGPAWSRSAFVFERNNGALLHLITGSKGVPMQIINRYIFKKRLQSLLSDRRLNVSTDVLMAIHDLNVYALVTDCRTILAKNATVKMLGRSDNKCMSLAEIEYVHRCTSLDLDDIAIYKRIVLSGSDGMNALYHSAIYTRPKKSSNATMRSDNNFYQILKFLTYNDINGAAIAVALCQELIIMPKCASLPGHIHLCDIPPKDNKLALIDVCNIDRICVLIDLGNLKYVCDLPNVYERD